MVGVVAVAEGVVVVKARVSVCILSSHSIGLGGKYSLNVHSESQYTVREARSEIDQLYHAIMFGCATCARRHMVTPQYSLVQVVGVHRPAPRRSRNPDLLPYHSGSDVSRRLGEVSNHWHPSLVDFQVTQ
jgi:hypothetical protein